MCDEIKKKNTKHNGQHGKDDNEWTQKKKEI